ncbi:MAG: hypothetical protein P8Q97_10740 [Myxococcota bacterium]|jgi:hypothetical protein|nr:hypothetical protein [Myxococcota bacterium]
MFGKRADGKQVREISTTRRFMPYLSPRRNSSLVYYTTEIEVDDALDYLDEINRDASANNRITLFHLFLRSLGAGLSEREGVNRFVAGRKLWQRDGVWLTYSAKQEIIDGSPVITLKHRFDPEEDLDAMAARLLEELHARRRGRETTADKEVNLAIRLPGFVLRGLMAFLSAADYAGLLPRSMIEGDPMFSSVFVANLGSVGLDAGYHHLWEYGTCSIFAVVGQVHRRSDGARVMEVKYSYDERIADGLYAAITLLGVKQRLESPRSMD